MPKIMLAQFIQAYTVVQGLILCMIQKAYSFFIRIFLSKNMRLKNYQHLLKNFLGIYRG